MTFLQKPNFCNIVLSFFTVHFHFSGGFYALNPGLSTLSPLEMIKNATFCPNST